MIWKIPLPDIDRREILRYAGAKEETDELRSLLDDTLQELLPLLAGKVCWQEYPLTSINGILDLGFSRTSSISLNQTLSGCDRIVVFAATVGLGPDRLIARYKHLSPSRALLLQAVGTERIEALCDTFCTQISLNAADRGLRMTRRFSPGYGDLPLDLQKDIFRVLDCPRKIGLTLNSSLLMSPSKSVTAIIGLGPQP